MTVYPNQNYPNQVDSQEYVEYDLASEKKRIAEGTEEIKKELLAKWQKTYQNAQIFPDTIKSMNPALINLLLSFENTLFYNDLAKKFALTQEQRDALPQIVWTICQSKNWTELETLLQNNLNLASSQSGQIAGAINNQILSKAKILPTTSAPATPSNTVNLRSTNATELESLTLSEVLRIYPELGEQAITGNHIKIMSFPEPVRPSIKNWIADYTYALGRETHSAIVRSNYLFHSKNTQGLSSADRAKLSYILKAFDEKSLVTVDKVSKKIVFSDNNLVDEIGQADQIQNSKLQIPNKSQIQNSNIQNMSEVPANKISFSSPQKLAYERKDVPQDQPYRITPATQTRPQPIENRTDTRVLGKNVVNLRD